MNSPFQNCEMEIVLSNAVFVLAHLSDDWAGFSWDQYTATCEHKVSGAERGCLEDMVERGWLEKADEQYTPTETFISYVRKNDIRNPKVKAASEKREAARVAEVNRLRPMVDARTKAALERIPSITDLDEIDSSKIVGHFTLRVMKPWSRRPSYDVGISHWFWNEHVGRQMEFEIPEAEFSMEVLRTRLREIVNQIRKDWELPVEEQA